MKKAIFILSIVLTALAAHAKIWRVNNNPGVVADFTTAQAAHNAASNGDIIHLEPSPSNYGNVVASKTLTWISIGAFLSTHPGLQHSTISGKTGNIDFQTGSQGSIAYIFVEGNIQIFAPNITISRCLVTNAITIYETGHNAVITQNYCNEYLSLLATNTLVSNNIIVGIVMGSNATGVITHNIIANTSGSSNIYNSTFQNNISGGFNFNFINSNVSYNMIANNTGLPIGNGNILNANMANVFINFGQGSLRVDKDFQLKALSPAIGAAFDGGDMGAFGGPAPFVLALQPAIPAVTSLNTSGINNGGSINVIFSAKSNQ